MGLPTSPSDATTRAVVAGHTDTGQVRSINQDSFFVGEVAGKGYLAVVADGMGGHKTGEIASQKAVELLRLEIETSRAHPPAAIARAVQVANLEIYNDALANLEHRGMGTTLTAVFLDDQVGLVGHIGDSRAYLIRDDEIRQLTQDHSWVADRVRQGLLSEDEARSHRWRNVITNALGAMPEIKLDILAFEVREGDRLLLCSDGVSMLLSDALMFQIVQESAPEEAVHALIAQANERGSPDNVTAVVLQVTRLQRRAKRYALPPAAPEPESITITETMSGIRRVEAEFPIQDLFSRLRKQPWYPYRLWIVGSLYLLLMILIFSMWR